MFTIFNILPIPIGPKVNLLTTHLLQCTDFSDSILIRFRWLSFISKISFSRKKENHSCHPEICLINAEKPDLQLFCFVPVYDKFIEWNVYSC